MATEKETLEIYHNIVESYLKTKGNSLPIPGRALENTVVTLYFNLQELNKQHITEQDLKLKIRLSPTRTANLIIHDRSDYPNNYYIPSYMALEDPITNITFKLLEYKPEGVYQPLYSRFSNPTEQLQNLTDLLINLVTI